ncbi:MAG TPA: hypothetical protein VIZ28_13060 [Chitinophagaceae bacterium]
MKLTVRLLFLLTISLCFCNCSNNDTKSKKVAEIGQPEFVDNGKAVDSLKKVYNCESIEYDNWEENDATDSCLTVCLINSNKVPSGDNVDDNVNQLKGIALTIKTSLAKPENYNSFYIIFVEKENMNGLESKSHAAGMEISSKEL